MVLGPGSRIQGSKSTQSRIPDPDPQHWVRYHYLKKESNAIFTMLYILAVKTENCKILC